ncbi:unnamed protein product [Anisakis simplex]|uniref:Alkylated DNA repair protein alkB homolog 1 (inferred by orthology to a human protein) n=1 Tax=Anisakis simplex TaxID=6269 RepID=A0A0M3JTC4_ANISI|nr:unnamed protein product [Anisakis simplex]
MSSLPKWWPYKSSLQEAGRRLVALLGGIIVGANAVTHYYKPLAEFESELAKGKSELLLKTAECAGGHCYHSGDNGSERVHEKNIDSDNNDYHISNSTSRSASPADSVFKRAFKYYKKRSPAPDLSNVIDFRAVSDPRSPAAALLSHGQIERLSVKLANEHVPCEPFKRLGLKLPSEWNVFAIANRQGLYILSDVVERSKQLEWISKCLHIYPEAPNKTNVHLHNPNASEIFKNHGKNLRWTTMGYHYDWTTKKYPETGVVPFYYRVLEIGITGDQLPSEIKLLAEIISNILGLGEMEADAVIINYFPPKSTLSAHVDRSEHDLSKPLISLSLGQSAVYLSGGRSVDDSLDAILLHSGDVLVMHAQQRLVYHAVPRIIKTTDYRLELSNINTDQPKELIDYVNTNRISITIRQVDRH